MKYIVIGASRGLGLELVKESLASGAEQVVAISRTPPNDFFASSGLTSEQVSYHQMDVSDISALEQMRAVRAEISDFSDLCIIFNAAIISKDISKTGEFDLDMYVRVSAVAVAGLGIVIKAFGDVIEHGRSMLMVVSSSSTRAPLISEPMIAYVASKSFLESVLTSLRFQWGNKARLVTVMLGHVGGGRFKNLPEWLVPGYRRAARRIVAESRKNKHADTITIPVSTCTVYLVLGLLPHWLTRYIFANILSRLCSYEQRKDSFS